jgi:hypothetical protein
MRSVIFHPLAEQELLDAVSYYEEIVVLQFPYSFWMQQTHRVDLL